LHILYIDGLNLRIKILRPGESDTITIYSKREGVYGYYDRLAIVPLGYGTIITVNPEDWARDLENPTKNTVKCCQMCSISEDIKRANNPIWKH